MGFILRRLNRECSFREFLAQHPLPASHVDHRSISAHLRKERLDDYLIDDD